jgi:hypothetical protein
MIQKLMDKEELLGTDVIVPHRMLKNHVIEETGVEAYILFSDTAAKKLNLKNLCNPLIPHTETYEHLGEVQTHVYNLRTAWENYLEEIRYVVNLSTAWIKIELDVPFPPSLIWDYITTPELEASVLGLMSVTREDDLGGRTRPGANFHCAHSSGDFYSKIVDWKPFRYYTTHQSFTGGIEYYRTIRLDFDGRVTKFGLYVSKPEVEPPSGFREFLEGAAREGYERISSFIQADIDSGKISFNQR